MLLVNLSGRRFREHRRQRNEAFFHHLLAEAPELDGGVFVNRFTVGESFPGGEVHRGAVAGKPFRVLQPAPDLASGERMADLAEAFARDLAGGDYALLVSSAFTYTYHLAMALVPGARTSILDLADDFGAWNVFGIEQRTRDLVAAVDKVVYVNERTRERWPHPRGRVFVNGCDWESYQRPAVAFAEAPFWPKPPGARYAGFLGGLFPDRLDIDLLEAVMAALPSLTFLFVGESWDAALLARITSHPNARFVPEVSAALLPAVVRSFDVGIVPFLRNPITDGSDLLKVLDYLAAGIPVVSTPCAGVERHGAAVTLAAGAEAFARALAAAVSGPHDPAPGLAIAAAMDWAPRLRELGRWLFAP